MSFEAISMLYYQITSISNTNIETSKILLFFSSLRIGIKVLILIVLSDAIFAVEGMGD
jgi:hypothetical protein